MTPKLPPLAHDLPPSALEVLGRATRHATPCGDGELIWHTWGHGRPLVLFHGGSGSWAHWVRNVDAFAAAGRRVIVPDLPGFGDSAPPRAGEDADAMVAPVARGMRDVAGTDGLDVVGFSFGGMLSVMLAVEHPEMVGRLVIAGAPGLGLRTRRLPLQHWRHVPQEAARRAIHRRNLEILMLHDPAAADDDAVSIQSANTLRDRMRGRRLAMTNIVSEIAPRLRCPVDAIYGEEDALYKGQLDRAERLLRKAPRFGEMVVVRGAGHWVQYEAAQAFGNAVLRLLY